METEKTDKRKILVLELIKATNEGRMKWYARKFDTNEIYDRTVDSFFTSKYDQNLYEIYKYYTQAKLTPLGKSLLNTENVSIPDKYVTSKYILAIRNISNALFFEIDDYPGLDDLYNIIQEKLFNIDEIIAKLKTDNEIGTITIIKTDDIKLVEKRNKDESNEDTNVKKNTDFIEF